MTKVNCRTHLWSYLWAICILVEKVHAKRQLSCEECLKNVEYRMVYPLDSTFFTLFYFALPFFMKCCSVWLLLTLLKICFGVPTKFGHMGTSQDTFVLGIKRKEDTPMLDMLDGIEGRLNSLKLQMVTSNFYHLVLHKRSMTCMIGFVVKVMRAVIKWKFQAACWIWRKVCCSLFVFKYM